MKFKFQNKKISGILTVIPKKELSFDDYADKFQSTPKQMKRLKEVMGFDKRRVAELETSFSDMAVFGVEKILSKGLLKSEEIGAIIVVTHHPDYFTPPTSNIIQGRLNLPTDVYCLDINDGCCGYVLGLIQSFQLLEHMTDKKILLIVGMVRSKKESLLKYAQNRSDLLWGDAVSVSIVENTVNENSATIEGEVEIYGKKWDCIRRPIEGFRKIFATQDNVNISYFTDTFMDGGEVFKFTQIDVPSAIEKFLADSGKNKNEIDWFLFHQPNKLLVEELAEELRVPLEKTPSNVVSKFGNSAGATIPINICYNLTPDILTKTFNVCMSGFGVGLTIGILLMQLGPLNFCEFAEY